MFVFPFHYFLHMLINLCNSLACVSRSDIHFLEAECLLLPMSGSCSDVVQAIKRMTGQLNFIMNIQSIRTFSEAFSLKKSTSIY